MCGSPPPHHFILDSVSTSKHDDLSVTDTFMHGSSPTHHCITFSTFKHDDLSALIHLWIPPPNHITLSLVQIQHSSVMTFLHLNIYALVSLAHHFILVSVSTFKCNYLSALNIYASTLPHLKSAKKVRHNRLRHLSVAIQCGLLSQNYASLMWPPNLPFRKHIQILAKTLSSLCAFPTKGN